MSVVIPVKNGARYLDELLRALAAERDLDVLLIDSGSHDGSVEMARAAGVRVLEIAPAEFGHGRTRNLGAEETSGELVAFLTQDATPCPGWADAYREAFAGHPRLGAAYGPHLPRADTSPMIARELTEFFATFGTGDEPVLQDEGTVFLSNVNACYRRACWEQVRFADVPYAEDQAFARAMPAHDWLKAYVPRARVLHAHDYPAVGFMRRYFDEYRGLRETLGHVEPLSLKGVRGQVAADRAWLREQDASPAELARWTARSALHHCGRRVFSALGSRAERLPAPVRGAISLEGRGDAGEHDGPPRAEPVPAKGPGPYADLGALLREGPVPLLDPIPGQDGRERLRVAVVIPYFRRGSGGHNSIFQICRHLESFGHVVSIWIHDPNGHHAHEGPGAIRRSLRDWFAPLEASVHKGLDGFPGADVAVATGWETVFPVMRLANCRSRVYLVHDHEPEFFPTSAEHRWAADTYELGLHAICASPWLAEIVERRYGGTTSQFQFGVDHDVYVPRPVPRDPETVIFYGRSVTGRRAVPLGVLALEELRRRRPSVRVQVFGDVHALPTPFAHEHLGIATPRELSWAFSQATVGLVLSMTNYSLIPQEMLACGLPCVDLAGYSAESVFGADGPVELAAFDPQALADAIEALLDDPERWRRRSQAGRAFVAGHTWEAAARQVEAGMRAALRERITL